MKSNKTEIRDTINIKTLKIGLRPNYNLLKYCSVLLLTCRISPIKLKIFAKD